MPTRDPAYAALFAAAPDAVLLVDPAGLVRDANPAALALLGRDPGSLVGTPAADLVADGPSPDEIRAGFQARGAWAGELGLRRRDGSVVPVEARLVSAPGPDGPLRAAFLRDLTGRRRAEAELRDAKEGAERAAARLAVLNEVGRRLTAETDHGRLLQAVVDAATGLTGAAFGAFFFNAVGEDGAAYALYALSGAPREAFARYPLPRATAIFGPTFRGEAPVRLDDVRRDPRFGRNAPYGGLPEGHLPVASYLAVPVASRSGEVLGGLFFGHPEPGVFGPGAEELAVGLAAHAAVALENARLLEQARAGEELMRAAFEGASGGMALVGLDGRWLRVNAALCDILGYPEDELLRLRFQDVTHPDDLGSDVALAERLLAGGVPSYQIEKRYLRKDGHGVWVLLGVGLVRDATGGPLRFVAQVQDVSARKAAEAERAHLAAIVDSTDDAVLSKDLDGTVRSWNAAAERMYGWTAAEMVGQSIGTIVPPDRREELAGILARLGRGERVERLETVRVAKDGRWLDVSLTVSPVAGPDGRVAGASAVARDVTAQKRAQAELAAAKDEAEEASRLKDAFLRTMSHELRTPLTAIVGYADLLRAVLDARGLAGEAADAAQVLRSGEHLLALINDLLDVSRLQAGRLELDPEAVGLAALVEAVLADLAPQAAAKGLALAAEVPPGLVLRADPLRLRQVLLNLAGNAVKFTERGEVRIAARAVPGAVEVAVRDTGIGIPAGALPHVFDEFRQADASTTRRYGGTGLGLAIARRLVELHGGTLRAESTPGVGSTFTVSLPAG